MKNITSLILIAVSVGLFFVYISPEYSKISNLRADKASYEDALVKSKDLKTLRDSILTKYNSVLPEDKEKLQRMIPSKFDPVKLVLDMSIMAAKYGMSIKEVKILDQDQTGSQDRSGIIAETSNNSYKTASVSFVTSGQYPDFINLLKNIESSVELVDIKKLTISKSAQSVGNLDFKVVADTYYIN